MLTNDQNIQNLKTRKILRVIIMIGFLLTMITSVLSLILYFMYQKITFYIPLLFFLITSLIVKKRESIPLNKSKELLEIEKELKEHKKKGKRI